MDEERPQPAVEQRRRDPGVDTLRYGCAFAVVVIHSLPLSTPVPLWAMLVWACCVAAVPFFFIAAGYFLRQRERFHFDIILVPLRRLLLIYVFWMFVYFLLLKIIPIRDWSFPLRDWLWGGTAYHLWFIPALGFALAFVGVGLSVAGPWVTGLACAALAAVALTRGAYHDVLHLSGTPSIHNGQLAGPLYVYIGAMLARRRIVVGWWWLAALLVLAYGLLIGENLLIIGLAGEPLNVNHDVVLSVFVMGTVLFLVARAIPDMRPVQSMARLGRISLSVYAVHLFILWLLLPVIGNDSPGRMLLLATIVFALATVVSLGLQRVPALRWFVR